MKINFLGDIGLFKKFEELKIDPFLEVQLPDSDLTIGNFEFIVPRNGKKFFYDVQDKYNCSHEYLETLSINKFQGLGLANNHSLDYGPEGALDTMNYLTKAGIVVFGFSSDNNYTLGRFEVKGIRVGVIACVKKGRWSKEIHGYGPDTYSVGKICSLIKDNLNNFDHIIVYPHWGTELIEIPDLEDTENAKAFIDSGASAVIGHHPHVSQGIEVYGKGIIAYSLGSFIYISEEEVGYSAKNTSRDISICLHVEFSKEKILGYQAFYYRYNHEKKIPEPVNDVKSFNYALYLDSSIYNRKLYNNQILSVLLKRELRSFFERFRDKPLKTLFNYGKYLIQKVLK
jgi:poly-gamma-glutamate capsule biosynthesis protein CapA/YwtB (metallophosphatase superfamily)